MFPRLRIDSAEDFVNLVEALIFLTAIAVAIHYYKYVPLFLAVISLPFLIIWLVKKFRSKKSLISNIFQHVLCVGSTGTGKTTLAVKLIKALPQGQVVVIDPKGDKRLLEALKEKGETMLFTPYTKGGLSFINASFPSNELADVLSLALIPKSTTTEYFSAVQRGILLAGIEKYRKEGGNFLQAVYSSVPPFVKKEHASGLLMNISVFFKYPVFSGGSLEQAILQGKNLYIYTMADRLPDFARFFGKLIVLFIRQTQYKRRRPLYLLIDEFSEVVFPGFDQFLSKARSYNTGILLFAQGVGDILRERGGRALLSRIVNNVYTKIVFRLGDPAEAMFFSSLAGYKIKTLSSYSAGRTIRREQRLPAIEYRDLLSLKWGKALVFQGGNYGFVRLL